MVSLLYRGRLRYYIEDKVGVCIIDSIPHCHTENALKRDKNQEMWLRCYIEGGFVTILKKKLEYVSSIVFHTAILKSFKRGENLEMWLRFYIEGGQNWRIYHR